MTSTPLTGYFLSGGSTSVSPGNSSGTLNITLSTVNALQGPATCSGDLAVTGALTGPTITGLQQQIQSAAGGTALATRVTAAESRIDTLNASLANFGSSSQITALQTQVNTATATNTTQDTAITALQTRATSIETKKHATRYKHYSTARSSYSYRD